MKVAYVQSPSGVEGIFKREFPSGTVSYRAYARDGNVRQFSKTFRSLEAAVEWKSDVHAESLEKRNEIRGELRRLRRERSVRTADALADAYAQLRRLVQLVDVATAEAMPRSRRHLRAAVSDLYRAEDRMADALSEERGAA